MYDNKKVTLIASIARDGAIGVGGDMVYHLRGDLRHFKARTMGRPVVMGRRTWESLPSGALPGRRNIVITSAAGYRAPGAETAASLAEALSLAAAGADEIMVLGGGRVYAEAMPLADELELTIVDHTPERADTFFPPIDPTEWAISAQEDPATDEPTGLTYRFVTLTRPK